MRSARHLRWCLVVACATCILVLSSSAWADVQRFGLFIGNNVGSPEDVELAYANSDAAKLHDTFRNLGGIEPGNLVLLRGENADTIRRTLIGINDRIRAARSSSEVSLVVYYSGHADAAALHLGKTKLAIAELEQLVRGSAAEFRLLVLDACRSGTLTRVKGGQRVAPVPIQLDGRLAGEGVIFWTASSANEDAQESDALKGSFFSHYLNSALIGAGDLDGDGRITVDEAFRYASDHTIHATSSTFGGTQHPTFRYELQGQGKVVLTSLTDAAADRGIMVLPPGLAYLVFGPSGAVVGEVGINDKARKIATRPGEYLVRGRGPDVLLEMKARIGAGETRELRSAEFDHVAYARLVRKGGGPAMTSTLAAGYRFHTPLANARYSCHGFVAGYEADREHLALGVRLGGCRAAFRSEHLEGSADELTLDVRVRKSFDLPLVSPYVGIELGPTLFRQQFDTRGPTPDVVSLGAAATAFGGARIDLPAGFGIELEVGAAVYLLGLEESTTHSSSARANFALRPSLALAKTW